MNQTDKRQSASHSVSYWKKSITNFWIAKFGKFWKSYQDRLALEREDLWLVAPCRDFHWRSCVATGLQTCRLNYQFRLRDWRWRRHQGPARILRLLQFTMTKMGSIQGLLIESMWSSRIFKGPKDGFWWRAVSIDLWSAMHCARWVRLVNSASQSASQLACSM